VKVYALGAVSVAADEQHIDGVAVAQALSGVEQTPELSRGPAGDQPISLEIQGRGHHAPEQGALRATNQVYAGKGGVQAPSADPVCKSVSANAGRLQLLDVDMAVLELGKPRHLGVTRAASQLKPTNCAAQL
jgi:hypothetical protein